VRNPVREIIEGRKRSRSEWARRVSKVFSRNPRDGSHRDVFWVSRDSKEERLCELLSISGANVCLDGSTGTGKSSLACTELGFLQRPYVEVQVSPQMDWEEFLSLPCITSAEAVDKW
jgi:MoxR-like ATPase